MIKGFKHLIKAVLISIIVLSAGCNGTQKYISKGYAIEVIDGKSAVQKRWSPSYFKYKKKRFTFVPGHYRIIVGRSHIHNVVRSRNQ